MKIYTTRQMKLLLILQLSLFTRQVLAQTAPNISYVSPPSYKVGTMVAPLGPTNTGDNGAVNGQTSTFAGSGTAGYANGQGTTASFNLPLAIAQDAQNNLYVADYATHIIRKITPTGYVTTLAGSPNNHGTADGTASTARFNQPRGLVVDAVGNIYVADYGNNLIRKITPAGVVTTVAGSGTAGSANGTGNAASFNGPLGLAIDGSGNVLVTDNLNQTIRKVTPAGVVTTLTGTAGTAGYLDGPLASALFNRPYGIGLDQSGNIYVADRTNCKIRKISTAGVVSTLAGSTAGFNNANGTAAKFNNPCGLSLDKDGNIYVADNANQRIRKVTPAGSVSTVAGTGTSGYVNGTGDSTLFYSPFSIFADNDGGFLYVGDYNNRIRTVAISPFTIAPDLPAGLNFDTSNGAITGVPQVASATTNYTVTAYNGTGTDTGPVTITVLAADAIGFSDLNYITSYTPRVAGITSNTTLYNSAGNQSQVQTAVQYFDGLGRPMQTVQVKGSPTSKDVVQPVVYDQYSREATKYLPYASTTGGYGTYKTDALNTGAGVSAFYNPSGSIGTQQSNGIVINASPYSVTGYEPAPLNRPLEQGAPGIPWQLPGNGDSNSSGNTTRIAYGGNDQTTVFSSVYNAAVANIGSRVVAKYGVNINADQSRALSRTGNTATYPARALHLTIFRDENWQPVNGCIGSVEEYKDSEGRIVMKRRYNLNGMAIEMLSTYYVYDDKGNLAFVLPPGSSPDATTAISQTVLDAMCYQYRYDDLNRLTQKKIPGKGWEFVIYNALDQVVFTQDANQRNKAPQEWTFSKYDGVGRPIMNGVYQDAGSSADGNLSVPSLLRLQTLQGQVSVQTYLWETRNTSTPNAYTSVALPITWATTLTVNYYDSYEGIPGFPGNFTAPAGASTSTEGLLTAKKTAVLNNPADMLWDVPYYDDLGRTTTTYAQHYVGGTANVNNYDLTTVTYDFTNAPVATTRKHYISVNTTTPLVTVANRYIYDHMGRKLMTWEQITNGNDVPGINTLISKTEYNEIGQVTAKHLHSTNWTGFIQHIGYTYNERGWLVTSSAPLFAMQLYYNTGTNRSYNGNIMYQWSGVPTNLGNHYSYTYDKLNRLLSGNSTGMYNENNIAYDLQGNITALKRTTGSSAVTDDLSYVYTVGGNPTNQLQSVTDGTTSNTGLVVGATNYTYDANGNMLSNSNTTNATQNKTFTYNLLNLPQTVTLPNGTITYTYDAAGQKLRKVAVFGSNTSTTDYIGGIQYTNSTTAVDFIQTEEGRAVNIGGTYNYQYTLRDHLGNNRLSFDINGGATRTLQTDNYYPFGMEQIVGSVPSGKNEYLYNKKELQVETGLYDFGAREYDPMLGRWTTIDPLAEKSRRWSTYNYCMNNPIRFIDPDGMDVNFIDRTKDDSGSGKTQDLINKGLGGKYAIVEEVTGRLTLNISADKLKGLTKEQKAFYNVLNNAANDSRGDVNIDIVASDPQAEISDYLGNKIDIDDVMKFGEQREGADEFSVFGHELREQQELQLGSKTGEITYKRDHAKGVEAEQSIKDNTRQSEEDHVFSDPRSDGSPTGVHIFKYQDNNTKKVSTVKVVVSQGNVINVQNE